jgi:hypothetical protein
MEVVWATKVAEEKKKKERKKKKGEKWEKKEKNMKKKAQENHPKLNQPVTQPHHLHH